MWYAILAADQAGSLERRLAARPGHLERLRELQAQGRVLIAGPLPAMDAAEPGPAGFLGSLMVLEFESLDAARAWAQADPYLAAGVFKTVDVKPFVKVFPQ